VLRDFFACNRNEIVARTKVTVAGSPVSLATETELTEGLNDLIERSLAEVPLGSTVRRRERMLLVDFVQQLAIVARLEAKIYRHQLAVALVEEGVAIEVDRELLAMALFNLLRNAFKFTRAPGQVWLRTRATVDRVFIDIEDECGGLPPGQAAELFDAFDQRTHHSKVGLSVSRKAVQSNGGDIHVRNLPGRACIFTIDLPRKIDLAPAAPHRSATALQKPSRPW
jgi:signal transduction histidine kinase